VVEAQPTGHHNQPTASVIDATEWCLDQTEESLLDHILGRSDVAEHAECQVD
jgi:hypothetical protein